MLQIPNIIIPNSVLRKGKCAFPHVFNVLKVLPSTSDTANLLAEVFFENY